MTILRISALSDIKLIQEVKKTKQNLKLSVYTLNQYMHNLKKYIYNKGNTIVKQ